MRLNVTGLFGPIVSGVEGASLISSMDPTVELARLDRIATLVIARNTMLVSLVASVFRSGVHGRDTVSGGIGLTVSIAQTPVGSATIESVRYPMEMF